MNEPAGQLSKLQRGAEHRRIHPPKNQSPKISTGVLTCDANGNILSADQACLTLLGITSDLPMSPQEFSELAHIDVNGPMMTAWKEAVAANTEFTYDLPIGHPDGTRRLTRFHALPIPSNGNNVSARYVSTVIDISEQIDAAEVLQEREQNLDDVIEALHEGVLITGPDGIEGTNRALIEMIRVPPEMIDDPELFAKVGPVDLAGNRINFEDRASAAALRTGMPVAEQVVGFRYEDKERWLSINSVPRIVDGTAIGTVTTFRDITESKLTLDALAASEELHRTLTDAIPLGIYRSGLNGNLIYVNPAWSGITDIPIDQAPGLVITDLIHPADVDMVVTVFASIAQSGSPGNCQCRFVTRSGRTIWIHVYGAVTHDRETGEVDGFIGSIEDITPVVDTRNELARLAQIIERTSDLVVTIDPETFDITYLNRAARLLLGVSRADARKLHTSDMYTAEATESFIKTVLPKLDTYGTWTGDLEVVGPGGTTVRLTQTITIQRNPDGTIREYSAIGKDTTEQHQMRAELEHRANHDALTGLPNRSLLLDRISLALAKATRNTELIAVIFLDIDRFKTINDTYGHDLGDKFLREVAARASATLRPGDTVARLGGDEFVVLIEDVHDELHALTIAERITDALESQPYELDGLNLTTTVSGGIALSAGGPDEHADAILRDADAAMYRAKDKGRAQLELFDETMRKRAHKRLALTDELAKGIRNGEIEVHYQPVVNIQTGCIAGVEALARWRHPRRGLIPPDEFIPVAEESGLIIDLGLHVLETACRKAAMWQNQFTKQPLRLHVNLSARQLNSDELPSQVADILNSTGLARADLCLEITESTLMEDAEATTILLRELKRIGVGLAIDDFGTGYSSLAYLLRFPVDTLKIDRSFIDGLGPETEDSIVVEAIIKLASTLGLDVVAEGVETDEQLSHLQNLGCREAQGFLFTKPVIADEITKLLAAS